MLLSLTMKDGESYEGFKLSRVGAHDEEAKIKVMTLNNIFTGLDAFAKVEPIEMLY